MPRNIHTVAIVGPDTPLRRKLIGHLADGNSATRPIVCDPHGKGSYLDELRRRAAGEGEVDTVVVLATAPGAGASQWPAIDEVPLVAKAVSLAPDALLVVVTSSLVYGARVDNPIPLTEEAPPAPNPDLPFAARLHAIEQRGEQWLDDHRSGGSGSGAVRLAVLRPALVLGDTGRWPDDALVRGIGVPRSDGDPPMQFVHVDDLAGAIAFACEHRIEGTFNVASDGWLAGADVRALAGLPRHPLVPSRYARLRQRRTAAMGGLLGYATHPWVVANDRIKAAGWQPTLTNEQAFVAVHRGAFWTRLSPQRRQEFALVGAAGAMIGLVTAVAAAARRWWRR